MALAPPPFALITFSLLSTHWSVLPIDLEIGSAWRLIGLLGLLLGEASDAVCPGPAWARLWGSSRLTRMLKSGCLGPLGEAHREGEEKNLGGKRDHSQVYLSWPLGLCVLNAFAFRTGAACVVSGHGLFGVRPIVSLIRRIRFNSSANAPDVMFGLCQSTLSLCFGDTNGTGMAVL